MKTQKKTMNKAAVDTVDAGNAPAGGEEIKEKGGKEMDWQKIREAAGIKGDSIQEVLENMYGALRRTKEELEDAHTKGHAPRGITIDNLESKLKYSPISTEAKAKILDRMKKRP